MATSGARDLVRWFPAARSLSRADAERLLTLGPLEAHPAGAVLFEEGSPSDTLHLLLEGTVEVAVSPGQGPPVVLGRVEPGEVLGEMGVLEDAPRSGRAIAVSDVRSLRIDRTTFRALAADGDPIACWLLDVIALGLACRVSSMTMRVAQARLQPETAHSDLRDRRDRARRWWEVLAPWRRTA
jgi:CRP-like cAMP-binding protein